MKLRTLSGIFAFLVFTPLLAASHGDAIPITTDSAAARTLFIAGQGAADVGNGVEANRLFHAATRADPKFARAWLEVANNAVSGEEFNSAMKTAHSLAGGVSQGEALLIEINMRFMDNDFGKQTELANELVKMYPKSPRAWLTKAGVENGLNKFEAARDSARQAIELDTSFVPAYTALGASYVFNKPKDLQKAAKYYEKAIALQPDQDNHYWGLGDVYRAGGKLEKAAEYYGLATMLDPNNGTAWVKLGHVNSFLGNFDQARENYEHGIKVAQPEGAAFLANYKHFTWVHANQPKAGVEGLRKLYEELEMSDLPDQKKSGAMIFTLTNAALICMEKGMHDEADELIEMRAGLLRANAKSVGTPEFANIQEANIAFFKGQAAVRRGDLRTAKKMARENKRLVENEANPRKFEQYHQLMGMIYLEDRKPKKAVEHFRQADHENSIYVKYQLALALAGAGEKSEAEALFREVADWNFNSVGYALVRDAAMKHGS